MGEELPSGMRTMRRGTHSHPDRTRKRPPAEIQISWCPDGVDCARSEPCGAAARTPIEAAEFIERNFLSTTVIKFRDRAEALRVQNFPFAAVEEALSVADRVHSTRKRRPIEVLISREEIAIIVIPGSHTREAIPASRREKILRSMRANGSADPHFELARGGRRLFIRLPAHSATIRHDLAGSLPAK